MNPSYDLPFTVYLDGGDELRAALIKVCYAAESTHYQTGNPHESTETAIAILKYGIEYLKSFKPAPEIAPPDDEPVGKEAKPDPAEPVDPGTTPLAETEAKPEPEAEPETEPKTEPEASPAESEEAAPEDAAESPSPRRTRKTDPTE